MSDFQQLVDEFMCLDKKTLAELLALKEIQGRNNINTPYQQYPWICPSYPVYPQTPINEPWQPYITYQTNCKNKTSEGQIIS